MRDRSTGHSRGFGFVALKDGSRVDDAILASNGQRMVGRIRRQASTIAAVEEKCCHSYNAERLLERLCVWPSIRSEKCFLCRSGRLLNLLNTIAPAVIERLMTTNVERSHFENGKHATRPANKRWPVAPKFT